MRQWRADAVKPLLERANRVYWLLIRFASSINTLDATKVQAEFERLLDQGAIHEHLGHSGIEDEAFRKAFEDLTEAFLVCHELIINLAPVEDPRLQAAYASLRSAIERLNRAAEDYVHRQ